MKRVTRAAAAALLTVALCAPVALLGPSPAGAAITSVGGQITQIAPPVSARAGKLESDTTMHAWDEKQDVALPVSICVDITEPGLYDEMSDLTPGTISAGTIVRSHIIHADKVDNVGPDVRLEGSLVTDQKVIGIAILQDCLDGSDILGAAGTQYPQHGVGVRRLNFQNNSTQDDFVILQPDEYTVIVRSTTDAHFDQIRVITGTAPSKEKPAVTSEVHNSAHQDITGQVVAAGTVIHDKAIVTGTGPTPTGTVDFARFANGTCSGTPVAVEAGVALVNGVAESTPIAIQQGAMAYRVQYSGDASYEAGTGPCEPVSAEAVGRKGCTPGYWKQPHHFDSWQGFAPGDSWEAVFGVDAFSGTPSMVQVLSTGGGGVNALGRAATAALLNAVHSGVDYQQVSAAIITATRNAILSGSKSQIETLKNKLDAANNGGCPLN